MMAASFPVLPRRRSLRPTEALGVHDKEGCLCHIALDVDFKLTPQQLLDVFSHPGNPGIFRDVHSVPFCERAKDVGDGRQHWIMEQVSKFSFCAVPVTMSALLEIEKDSEKHTFKSINYLVAECKNALCRYRLKKQGRMKKFSGNWRFTPIYSEGDEEKIIGSRAILEQDMTPAHVPALTRGLFKTINRRALKRLVEDIHSFADKYHEGMPFFEPFEKEDERRKMMDEAPSS